MKGYIQPFERQLALRELESLAGTKAEPIHATDDAPVDYAIRSDLHPRELAEQLAYWEYIQADQRYVTTQALREATVNLGRSGDSLEQVQWNSVFNLESVLPNRRSLRYGPHGIHEYRGKFFPQLVRSLINIAGVPAHGIVGDPMSGSGTTLVEGILAGRDVVGLDMNPLSVFIGRTKCAVLSLSPEAVLSAYRDIEGSLADAADRQTRRMRYFESLPSSDQTYLASWFPAGALEGIDLVAGEILAQASGATRDLMLVSLSNTLRRVSWQMEDDLRVRKEVLDGWEPNVPVEFLEELQRTTRALVAFLLQVSGTSLGRFSVGEGDARRLDIAWRHLAGQVDAIITSPPYATALPYLDTDRLSLIYLRLLSRPEHRRREREMIGNREISEAERRMYRAEINLRRAELPEPILALIEHVERLNAGTDAGFRRRNLPALLGRYFLDMRKVLRGIAVVLKPEGYAYVVVGNNHTIAGGQRVEIDTASLLVQVAEQVGLRLCDRISMEMLLSRDIFRKNASNAETILEFRRSTRT